MIPRQMALAPIILLWVLLLWNAKVEAAIEAGDTYLMPEEIRNKVVWYLGYGPVLLQGFFIYLRLGAAEKRAASPTQQTRSADGQEQ